MLSLCTLHRSYRMTNYNRAKLESAGRSQEAIAQNGCQFYLTSHKTARSLNSPCDLYFCCGDFRLLRVQRQLASNRLPSRESPNPSHKWNKATLTISGTLSRNYRTLPAV